MDKVQEKLAAENASKLETKNGEYLLSEEEPKAEAKEV